MCLERSSYNEVCEERCYKQIWNKKGQSKESQYKESGGSRFLKEARKGRFVKDSGVSFVKESGVPILLRGAECQFC